MNGTGLAYADQEAAERAADGWRNAHRDLLRRLRVLNGSIDSLSLDQLIRDEETAHA